MTNLVIYYSIVISSLHLSSSKLLQPRSNENADVSLLQLYDEIIYAVKLLYLNNITTFELLPSIVITLSPGDSTNRILHTKYLGYSCVLKCK